MAQSQKSSQDAVSGLQPLSYLNQNQPSNVLFVRQKRAPTTNDRRFKFGTLWLDGPNEAVYSLVKVENNAATWVLLAQGTSDLETLTGDTGGALFPTGGNINILGGDTTEVDGSGSTLTINTSTNGYPITPFVVGKDPTQAGYATIQAGLDAANSAGGGAVYVQNGTYTEDLTLYDQVDIWGVLGIGDTAGCIIAGSHTPPASGSVTIRNVFLQNAASIFSSAVAGSALLVLIDVAINITSGYTFDLPNWTGVFVGFDIGEFGSTDDGWVNNTGGATVFMTNLTMGAGSGQSMITSGPVVIFGCVVNCPVSFQSGTIASSIQSSSFNQPITFADNSTGVIENCAIKTGSSTAITMNSSSNWTLSEIPITSSNSIVIAGTGAGTLNIGNVSYLDRSVIASTVNVSYTRAVGRITPFVVGSTGNYETIQAALDAANASGGGVVHIQTGSFTEDLTLYDAVSLEGANEQSTTITGIHTPPTTGNLNVFRLNLVSTTSIFSSAAAGSSTIIVEDCSLIANSGYAFDLLNWTGAIGLFDIASLGTNDGGINNTGGASIFAFEAGMGSGGSNTMVLSGGIQWTTSEFNCPIDLQTGALGVFDNNIFNNGVTLSNNSKSDFSHCRFSTGATAALTMNSTGVATEGGGMSQCVIDSSNSPAIAGTGAASFIFENISFLDNSVIAATVNRVGRTTVNGIVKALTFDTDVVTAGSTLSGTTLAADGTDANIDITLTPKGSGSVDVSSGSLKISSAGETLQIEGGTVTDFIGSATLSSGTVTVANTNIAANDRIFLTRINVGGGSIGFLTVSISAATSFTITSRQTGGSVESSDTSTIDYFIVREI